MTRKIVFPQDWIINPDPLSALQGEVIPVEIEVEPLVACENCKSSSGTVFGLKVDENSETVFHNFGGIRGSLISSPCPVCRMDEIKRRLTKLSGLVGLKLGDKWALDIKFENFPPNEYQTDAIEFLYEIVDDTRSARSLLICGGFGVGKTHLGIAFVNSRIASGIYAHYTTSARILNELKKTFGEQSLDKTDVVLQRYTSIPVLVVDEFNRIKVSEWAGEQIFEIFNRRFLEGRTTIFISNVGPQGLSDQAEEFAGIVSRITEVGDLLAIKGEDLRMAEEAVK